MKEGINGVKEQGRSREEKRDREGSGLGYIFPWTCTNLLFCRAIEK